MADRPKRKRTKPKEVYITDDMSVDDDNEYNGAPVMQEIEVSRDEIFGDEEVNAILDEFGEGDSVEDYESSEAELDEYDDLEKTKHGYAKDGFIDSGSESEYSDSDEEYSESDFTGTTASDDETSFDGSMSEFSGETDSLASMYSSDMSEPDQSHPHESSPQ